MSDTNQVFRVQGDLEIVGQSQYKESRGVLTFKDAFGTKLAQHRAYGYAGFYNYLIDSATNNNYGIQFRTSTSQGDSSMGGQSAQLMMEFTRTECVTPNLNVELKSNQYNQGQHYASTIFRISRPNTTLDTKLRNNIMSIYQQQWKAGERAQSVLGVDSYSGHMYYGYYCNSTSGSDLLNYGYLGVLRNNTHTDCLLLKTTGDVEIPTKLKATTIEATNWIGLPAVVVPSAQLLPLTLKAADGHVGINTTSPTEALDVQGNIKASGFITGQLTSGAQPGITGVGVLGGLDVTGDVDFASGLTVAHDLSVSGAVMASEAHVLGDLTAANATVSQVLSVMGSIQAPEAHILGTVTADRITANHYDNLPVPSLDPLTLDATNNRVGINQTTPGEALDVTGNIHATGSIFGTELLSDDILTTTITAATYNNLPAPNVLPLTLDKTNNRVGINQSNPTVALHVVGNIISGSIEAAGTVTTNNVTCFSTLDASIVKANTAEVATTMTAGNYTGDRQSFRVQNNGSVDINWLKTDFPTYQLNVAGNAQVTSTVFCDRMSLGTSSATNLFCSTGTPEGVQAAPVGSLWMRKDGSTGTTLYTKVSGTGNTGWQAIGGTPQIGTTVLAKLAADVSVTSATVATNLFSFNLPYAGVYDIRIAVKGAGTLGKVCVSNVNNSVGYLYPNSIPAAGGSTVFLSSTGPVFLNVTYVVTTPGMRYLNATMSTSAVTLNATETNIVATYKGVFP